MLINAKLKTDYNLLSTSNFILHHLGGINVTKDSLFIPSLSSIYNFTICLSLSTNCHDLTHWTV